MPSFPPLPSPSAGYLGDLHSFDPATMTWTLLSAADDDRRPSARSGHGFTSAGGLLYVHGGVSYGNLSLSPSLSLSLSPGPGLPGPGPDPARGRPATGAPTEKAGLARP